MKAHIIKKAGKEDHHEWQHFPIRHLLKTVAVRRPLRLVTENAPQQFSFKDCKYSILMYYFLILP